MGKLLPLGGMRSHRVRWRESLRQFRNSVVPPECGHKSIANSDGCRVSGTYSRERRIDCGGLQPSKFASHIAYADARGAIDLLNWTEVGPKSYQANPCGDLLQLGRRHLDARSKLSFQPTPDG